MERTYSAPAAKKTMCLLELMARENKPFSVTELATRLDVSSNSVFRILKELEALQYVGKNAQDSTYYLTDKLYYLGSALGPRISFRTSAQPYMDSLLALTNETVILTTFGTNYSTLIVDQKISTEPIKFISTVGLEYASYSSAMGKVMLAYLPERELEAYLAQVQLVRVTDYTIATISALREDLAGIRQQGYATDMQESVLGLTCVAAPVFSANGGTAGALGISGLTVRLPQEKLPAIARAVREQAALLSSTLGCALRNA